MFIILKVFNFNCGFSKKETCANIYDLSEFNTIKPELTTISSTLLIRLRVRGCRYESARTLLIAVFARRVTLNYAFTPFIEYSIIPVRSLSEKICICKVCYPSDELVAEPVKLHKPHFLLLIQR